ncbi:MAG: hypothetical protein Q4G36_02545 [Paracoccus sp. (in: a-proteobacteria)]|nr:hypothetical protein [Paracoccus sp. (in: a-proteobacteria)]
MSISAHEAMSDVEAMLWLMKVIAHRAPEISSRFMRVSTKAQAQDFLQEESPFVSSKGETAQQGFRLLMEFGHHPT